MADKSDARSPRVQIVSRQTSDYTPEQQAALEGLARLVVEVLNRELDQQRPELRRRRIKSL